MLKKVVLVSALVFANSFADGVFIGLSAGGALSGISEDSFVNMSGVWLDNELADDDKSLNALTYGAKVGYDAKFNDTHGLKAYVDYSRASFNGGSDLAKDLTYDIITLNADYHYYFMPELSVFGGLSLGNAWADTKGLYGKENALGYGVNVGLDYDISEHFEVEAKFRYFDPNFKEKAFEIQPNQSIKKVEPDDFSQILLGVNFTF